MTMIDDTLSREAFEMTLEAYSKHIGILLGELPGRLFPDDLWTYDLPGEGNYLMLRLGSLRQVRLESNQLEPLEYTTTLFAGQRPRDGARLLFEFGPGQGTAERLERDPVASIVLQPRRLELEELTANQLAQAWDLLRRMTLRSQGRPS